MRLQLMRMGVHLLLPVLLAAGPARAADTLAEHDDLRRRDGDQSEKEARAPLGTRAATKLAVYTDDDQLTVITPIISVSQKIHDLTSISLEYDADVLSAATVDVRTAATAKFDEIRHGVALAATHRVRDWESDLTASLSLSREADYASATLSAGSATDYLNKNLTLSLGYSYVLNAVGRSGSPFSDFLDTLHIHALDASLIQILSPRAYLQLGATLIGALGYQASVYRFVPLFLATQVDPAAVTEQALESGAVRPLLRPAEEVPRTRYRGALVLRANYAFDFGLTLSGDYRFYADSWAITSHTMDLLAYQALPLGLTLRLRNRLYYQTAADFYREVYLIASAGTLPEFYTSDRELGTFWYELAGVKLSLDLPFLAGVTVDAKVDVQHTQYIDFAYLPERTAIIVGGGLVLAL